MCSIIGGEKVVDRNESRKGPAVGINKDFKVPVIFK